VFAGKYHAGIITNSENMEAACVHAGRSSGDLVHPLPYTPELHFAEFSSVLADMKNSVAVSTNINSFKYAYTNT
jgi:probable aminopeptidase NPEPL1